MRINQLQEEGAKPIIDLKPNLEEYYKKHLFYYMMIMVL